MIDYSGLVNDEGMPYGIGRASMHGDQIYEGQCLHDRAHGYGRIIFNSNMYYVGQWRDGYFNGIGTKVTINLDGTKHVQHGYFENHCLV